MTGTTRSGQTWAVPAASAVLATTFIALHRPDAREQAIACNPRSRTSCSVPGKTVGIWSEASVASPALGSVDDLQLGSSPTSASTPPVGEVPAKFAWRIASIARSRPGFLPYQTPTTPSYFGSGSPIASCVPYTAVA